MYRVVWKTRHIYRHTHANNIANTHCKNIPSQCLYNINMYFTSQSQTATFLFRSVSRADRVADEDWFCSTCVFLHQQKLRAQCPRPAFPWDSFKWLQWPVGMHSIRSQQEVGGHLKQQGVNMWPSQRQTRLKSKLTLQFWLRGWPDYCYTQPHIYVKMVSELGSQIAILF